jgi:hypothetical protein
MTTRKKRAPCHPERLHVAFGLCSSCYNKMRYADPVRGARIKAKIKHDYLEMRADPVAYHAKLDYNRELRRRKRSERSAL